MKKICALFLGFLFLSLNSCGQNQDNSYSKTNDKDFNSLLNLFVEANLPLNYKKELENVGKSIKLKRIQKLDAMKYLKMGEDELFVNNVEYNYDTDEKTILKEENFPVAHLKYATDAFIVLIYRAAGKGYNDDSTKVYLQTLDKNGNYIDKVVIGERFTRENDWMSSVFLDTTHFKVFKYEVNWGNVQIKNNIYSIIDKDAPKTVVIVTDYEIENNGNIRKIKQYSKQYLISDILEYKKYDPNSDDIMNQYY
jgi:hypothetical protein